MNSQLYISQMVGNVCTDLQFKGRKCVKTNDNSYVQYVFIKLFTCTWMYFGKMNKPKLHQIKVRNFLEACLLSFARHPMQPIKNFFLTKSLNLVTKAYYWKQHVLKIKPNFFKTIKCNNTKEGDFYKSYLKH